MSFSTATAEKLLHKHTQTYPTPLTQHTAWLEDIRQTMWERTQFEDDMMPSDDALHLHWKRVCWVVDMWRQVNTHNLCLQPMTEYGWRLENDTLIRVSVDTLYRDGANDVSRERIQTAPLAHPGRDS